MNYVYHGPNDREYKCHWPGCQFRTKDRSSIDFHHIVPQELGPRLNSHVVLSFCPNHHRMIWHPLATHGHHSIKTAQKLEIVHIYPTAPEGYSILYRDMDGNEFSEFFSGKYNEN